jgi:hypothetical protein
VLRRVVLAYGGLSIAVAAVLLLALHTSLIPIIYLAVNGVVIVAALLVERARYRPAVDRGRGRWELTGERFVDPSSGVEMEVRYNSITGQRDYVPVEKGTRSR